MNTSKTLISLAVTFALTTSTTAFAKSDEGKKKSSVFTWGPWAGQVITAAASSGSWHVALSSPNIYGSTVVSGAFVAGIASPSLAIDGLVASLGESLIANYAGSNVNMSVNFSDSTWSGNIFSADDYGYTYTVSGGSVAGADFSATTGNITAHHDYSDGPISVVSGQIDGTIFGAAAETVGGIYDVTTSDDGTYRDVGLFAGTLQEEILYLD